MEKKTKLKMTIPWDRSWLVLVLLCVFVIASFVLVNAPGTFEWEIIDILHIDTYKYGFLVSLSSWSSLLDVFHGYLLDRYLGIISATWIYSTLCALGCLLYSVAGFTKDFWLMAGGRIIFGFGVNPMFLLVNKHIIHWFGFGEYVNFCNSIVECTYWLGSSFAFLITEPTLHWSMKYASNDTAFAIANAGKELVFGFIAITSMIVVGYMHKNKLHQMEKTKASNEKNNVHRSSVISATESFNKKPKLAFKDYFCISPIFWIYTLSVFLYYVSIVTFINMSLLYFKTKYHVSSDDAMTMSGLITIPCIGAPFFGLLLDKMGHTLTSFTAAILLNLLSIVLLNWTQCHPLLPILLMGLSLVASVSTWTQIQFLVEDHQYMIAYGVLQTGMCGSLAMGSTFAGLIIDDYGYHGFMIYLFSINASAVPVIAAVWFMNYRMKNFMNWTSKKKNTVLGKYKE